MKMCAHTPIPVEQRSYDSIFSESLKSSTKMLATIVFSPLHESNITSSMLIMSTNWLCQCCECTHCCWIHVKCYRLNFDLTFVITFHSCILTLVCLSVRPSIVVSGLFALARAFIEDVYRYQTVDHNIVSTWVFVHGFYACSKKTSNNPSLSSLSLSLYPCICIISKSIGCFALFLSLSFFKLKLPARVAHAHRL